MTPENPGGSEFAQFVAYEVLGDIHRDPGFAVIDRDSSAYHFRNDGGTPGIGFNHFPVPGFTHLQDFLVKALFNKGPFLN
jgi:hypothetical protein